MGYGTNDLRPPNPEAEVRKADKADRGDVDFWNQFRHPPAAATSVEHGPTVEALGVIGSLVLPNGWQKGAMRDGIRGQGYQHEYVMPGEHAKLTVSYGGLPMSDADGQSFLNVLHSAPHRLDGSELSSLDSVLGTRSAPVNFTIKSAYTRDCDSKRVLVVDGQRSNSGLHTQEDETVMFIPADRKGTVVQQISYKAPHDVYGSYLNNIKSALDNMTLR